MLPQFQTGLDWKGPLAQQLPSLQVTANVYMHWNDMHQLNKFVSVKGSAKNGSSENEKFSKDSSAQSSARTSEDVDYRLQTKSSSEMIESENVSGNSDMKKSFAKLLAHQLDQHMGNSSSSQTARLAHASGLETNNFNDMREDSGSQDVDMRKNQEKRW